jgi:hypothetical protein
MVPPALDEVIRWCRYAIGGQNDTCFPPTCAIKTVESFNASSNKWVTREPLHQGRAGAGVAVVNDHIFVFGGRGLGTAGLLTSVEEYDPTTSKWTITAGGQQALPGLAHMGVGVVDGVIYAIDGSDGYLDGQPPPVRGLRVSNQVYGLAVVEGAKSFVSTGNTDTLLSRAGVGAAVAVGKCYWSARPRRSLARISGAS